MNKQKGIVIGVLAFAVTMMVGYAIFSQNITINGTATAKGDFNISYTCDAIEYHGAIGECTIDGNKIITTSNLPRPDASTQYNIIITNSGSIPVVLKSAKSSNNYNMDFTAKGNEIYLDKETLLLAWYSFPFPGPIGDTEVENEKITLQPGKSILMEINHVWDDYNSDETTYNNIGIYEQPKLPEEGVTMTYDIELGFEQITAE